jgi:ceramide glucosyltransferase
MDFYFYIAWLLIALQLPFSLLAVKNYLFALAKYNRHRRLYSPRVALIIPCKNLDENFEQNIASFYRQDYENYLLLFVVENVLDPAYETLCRIKDELGTKTNANKGISVLIAGVGEECSQKIHNLLYAYRQIPGDIEVLAFADSDICVKPTWLRHLVHRLQFEQNGATSGYRWFVPKTNNFATIALSALNAKVAQFLGNSPFNQAWGGSMAIKVQVFRELGIEKLWQRALSDDLSLGCAIKSAHKKIEFVPGCLVTTSESATWAKLFEFGRRQFLITRVYAPRTWFFGLFNTFYSVFGLWGGAALAIYASFTQNSHIRLFVAVPVLFFIAQLTRAILRQRMARKLLAEDWPKLKIAAIIDIALFWLWSPLMLVLILSSAFGRTIRWRGIQYKIVSQNETIVLGS